MTDKPIVGFIGVGLMGHGMAKNILEGGYRLQIKGNRNRAPVEDLVGRGATEATSAKAMAEACDIVHICLSNSPQVEEIIRGSDGILASGKAGLVVVDCTTSDPNSTDALAAELSDAGMTLVDAPLGRTPKEAEEGTLDAMVGCDAATFEVVRPVIECWSGSITHIGETGTAHRMKLIMNFIAMSYGALFAEALSLGVKSGISPQTVRDVMGASRMSNGFFDTFMSYAVDRNRDAHKFSITNALKDMTYVASMAQGAGAMNPIGAAARNYYAHVAAIGEGSDYVPMVADHVARLNGIDLADAVKKGAK
ncbi:NAD(P)-dependent oxidoreductase [Palleronia sp. LCG004]|uniref:NAD(P)-dependent oxidoreductase n=1 Tax=Palleronia sp. LCG004 TaxID=3079304 RepID=UPI0029439CFD|nr:NAD(P)-dependent oxidoreductase [Palleronia sp. LCG004]WOI56324.1 NAD(P)-dependent oxidoreductase [Palleronia sp. LCG004]